jgi:threonine aldolase
MLFTSDNWAGAHPRISEALSRQAGGFDPAYGNGQVDRRVAERFSEVFEREVAVFFVATGTAANALSLALYTRPGGISFCHTEAHVTEDECGAPEYLSGGGRMHTVGGSSGRMDPHALRAAVSRYYPLFVHAGRPTAITVTQATEAGTVYDLDAIAQVSDVAKEFGLALHMDGARFANALTALDATPAEMTWKRGVDVLSFGGTKNGCWCAEAIVLFDTGLAEEMGYLRKRAAQLFSKSRFVAAQFEAYLADGMWLETAAHANATAALLADALRASPLARLAWEPQANEIFGILDRDAAARAREAGASFYDWPTPRGFDGRIGDDETLCRFVTSFATSPDDVRRFGDLIRA